MFKNLLVAAVIVSISPAFVFADDIFFAFGDGQSSAATDTATTTTGTGSGSVYIYSDANFAFDAADLYFENSDSSVAQITGGEAFNEPFLNSFKFQTEDGAAEVSVPPTGDNPPPTVDGRLFLVSVNEFGVNPALASFDPAFRSSVGVNGAILLGRVDYDIVGIGVTDFAFSFGPNGIVQLEPNPDFDPDDPDSGEQQLTNILTPTFGSARLNIVPSTIPEPSSLALLMLGSIGLVARRRRA